VRGCGAAVFIASVLLAASACAPAHLILPTGSGAPFRDYRAAFDQASAPCRGVHSLTAELALSGRAGSQKLRGRILAGLERPGSLRLEGVAPFGAPAFIVVAHPDEGSTLLLPRDGRVLSGVPPAAMLDALVGIDFAPDDLLAILAGCVASDPQPAGGRAFNNGWASIDLAKGATAYLRRGPAGWRVSAGTTGDLTVQYSDFLNGIPRQVRLRSAPPGAAGVATDLTVRLAQLELNSPIDRAAFSLIVPADAVPLTIEELRQIGPLGRPQ
jgi:hypothetical protein